MNGKHPSQLVVERTYRADPKELWDLWTTKEGFESWWGPEGFRAQVHTIEAREGGRLHYDMIADTPEMVAAMKQMGRPASHETHGRFAEFRPYQRLTLIHVIEFLPGVKPYESTIDVDFIPSGESVRMVSLCTRCTTKSSRRCSYRLHEPAHEADKRYQTHVMDVDTSSSHAVNYASERTDARLGGRSAIAAGGDPGVRSNVSRLDVVHRQQKVLTPFLFFRSFLFHLFCSVRHAVRLPAKKGDSRALLLRAAAK
jgi:uncharacterized protein YndB with AHSA1/START domain